MADTHTRGCIFDCGETDTMTPEKNYYIDLSCEVDKSYIRTANGELIIVVGSRTIEISPTLRLTNYLYVPTVSQISKADVYLSCHEGVKLRTPNAP